MFPTRAYANRMFAPRYFPKVGADPVAGTTAKFLPVLGVGSWLLWLLLRGTR